MNRLLLDCLFSACYSRSPGRLTGTEDEIVGKANDWLEFAMQIHTAVVPPAPGSSLSFFGSYSGCSVFKFSITASSPSSSLAMSSSGSSDTAFAAFFFSPPIFFKCGVQINPISFNSWIRSSVSQVFFPSFRWANCCEIVQDNDDDQILPMNGKRY